MTSTTTCNYSKPVGFYGTDAGGGVREPVFNSQIASSSGVMPSQAGIGGGFAGSVCVTESVGSGGGSPYIFDFGASVLLGCLLIVFINFFSHFFSFF